MQVPVQQRDRPLSIDMMRSEREKIIAGDFYRPNSHELYIDREHCQELWARFNNYICISIRERDRLFRLIFGGSESKYSTAPVGRDVRVAAPFRCNYGYNITIGHNTVINHNCYISNPRNTTSEMRLRLAQILGLSAKSIPTIIIYEEAVQQVELAVFRLLSGKWYMLALTVLSLQQRNFAERGSWRLERALILCPIRVYPK